MQFTISPACNRSRGGLDIMIHGGDHWKIGKCRGKAPTEFTFRLDARGRPIVAPGKNDRICGFEIIPVLITNDQLVDTKDRRWEIEKVPDEELPEIALLEPIACSVGWTNGSRPLALLAVPENSPSFRLVLEIGGSNEWCFEDLE